MILCYNKWWFYVIIKLKKWTRKLWISLLKFDGCHTQNEGFYTQKRWIVYFERWIYTENDGFLTKSDVTFQVIRKAVPKWSRQAYRNDHPTSSGILTFNKCKQNECKTAVFGNCFAPFLSDFQPHFTFCFFKWQPFYRVLAPTFEHFLSSFLDLWAVSLLDFLFLFISFFFSDLFCVSVCGQVINNIALVITEEENQGNQDWSVQHPQKTALFNVILAYFGSGIVISELRIDRLAAVLSFMLLISLTL